MVNDKVKFLVRLADVVEEPDRGRILNEALGTARSIEEEGTDPKAQALVEITERLPEGQHRDEVTQETLEAARDATHSMNTASVLIRILGILPAEQRVPLAREAAEVCRDTVHNSGWFCATALARLSALVPDSSESSEQMVTAITLARAMQSGSSRASTLIGVARHVSEDHRNELLKEVFEELQQDARLATDLNWQVQNLTDLLPLLSDEGRGGAVRALKQVQTSPALDARDSVKAKCALAQHSTPSERAQLIGEALQLARSFADGPEVRGFTSTGPKKATALRLIASVIQEPQRSELLNEALAASRIVGDGAGRVTGLAALVPKLPHTEREAFIAHMKSIIAGLHEPVEMCEARGELISSLPTADRLPAIADAISDASRIDSYKRENAMAVIARHVRSPEELALLVNGAKQQARPIHADALVRALAECLDVLSPSANEGLKARVLQAVLDAPSSASAAIAAALIARHVNREEQEELVSKALIFAQEIPHHVSRVEAMAVIAEEIPKLHRQAAEAGQEPFRIKMGPAALRRVALTLADGIVDPSPSAEAFMVLAARVDEPLRSELLNRAKEQALHVDKELPWERARVLAVVAEHMTSKECGPLLDELPKLLGYRGSDQLIAALAKKWETICRVLNVDPIEELGNLIRQLGNYDRRVLISALAALAPAIESVGGVTLARQTAETIVEAGQSWP
jgi:hypothetical protein